MIPDHIFIDIRTCDLTLTEAMQAIRDIALAHPEMEIFMDGDRYAIVGRRRCAA